MTIDVAFSGSGELTNFYIEGYADFVRLRAMQLESVLSGTVENDVFRGYDHKIDTYAAVSLTQRTDRYADNTPSEITRRRITVRPEHWEYTEYFDPRDTYNTGKALRPDSAFSRAVLGAFNQKKDDKIVAAFDGTYLNDAGSTVNFGATDDGGTTIDKADGAFASANSDGLTVAKVLLAYRTMRSNDCPRFVPWHCALHPVQVEQLLNGLTASTTVDPRYTGADYNALRPLQTGEPTMFSGFEFHVTTSIDQEAENTFGGGDEGRYAFFYTQTAMQLVMGDDFDVNFDIIADKGHSLQAAHYATLNATRVDGNCVVRVECVDTVA